MGRTLAQGQVFAGYTVERLLGVGGMGEVYLAKDKDLPRPVALKLLASGKADDPEVRARFLREADTAARLSHPNIVAVYARGNDDHRLWMAMQYVEGTDVSAILREGPVQPDHLLAGGLGIGFGTGAIHFGSGGGRLLSQPPVAGDAAQAAATKAACDYAELMTTYDYSDGDGWQSKVIAGATGTWKSEAETLLPTIRVLLESDSEHTRAADAACTVTSGRNTHYDLAVDVTQINSTQGKADTTDHQRITLSMEYVDGKWLCSNLVSPLFPS